MSPQDLRNPNTADLEYHIIDEAEIKDSKIAFMDMIEVLKWK